MSKLGAAALELRVSGASFTDIATLLGMHAPTVAIKAVTDELADRAEDHGDEFIRLRAEESARLETLIQSVWPKATDPECDEHLPAIRTAVSIIDRHAKLHGLDAPSEVVIHTPTATELDQWVSEMVAHSMPQLVEADIIEGEVLE